MWHGGVLKILLDPGLDLNPNPESCTLPLDQLAANETRIIPGLGFIAPYIREFTAIFCIMDSYDSDRRDLLV